MGAEAISAALKGVPQFSELSLWFSCGSAARELQIPPAADTFFAVFKTIFFTNPESWFLYVSLFNG